ncbi:MAG: ketoacyl-ACP synthase III [Limnobacter sp.]|nr:ketoacyl-ACP synthase III [Limnobacter sp.]
MTQYSSILGTGSCLPERVVSNDELVKFLEKRGVESSAEWIESRTGIQQRHFAGPLESTAFLAAQAASKALESAGVIPNEVTLIVVATSTSDQIFPSTACAVQSILQAKNAAAFDVQAVCSGFVYAMTIADSMIRSGQFKNALVIGSEVFSRLMDWDDRGTCVLFGDGAGAVFMSASSEPGVLACELQADGDQSCILNTPGRIENGAIVGDPFLRMDGQAVFKQAVAVLGSSALQVIQKAGITADQVDFLVPHQANVRILQAVAKRLKLSEEKTIVTVNQHGNTSAASVPLALDYAVRQNRIKKGHTVLLQGVGGGFTWGSVLVRM